MTVDLSKLREGIASLERNDLPLYVQSAGRSVYGADSGWGPGMRSTYLFCFVEKGSGSYLVDDAVYELKEGTFFLISPRRRVRVSADGEEGLVLLWVRFAGTAARELIAETELALVPVCQPDAAGEISALMAELQSASGLELWQRMAADGCLHRLFSVLLRTCRDAVPAARQDCAVLAAEYMIDHFEEPVTVEGLAAYTSVSHSSLYRRFVSRFGLSPKRFLLEYRVEQACRMLADSDCSVQEIAVSVGFEDPFYFSRAFKEIMGVSPRQYANAAREKSRQGSC